MISVFGKMGVVTMFKINAPKCERNVMLPHAINLMLSSSVNISHFWNKFLDEGYHHGGPFEQSRFSTVC